MSLRTGFFSIQDSSQSIQGAQPSQNSESAESVEGGRFVPISDEILEKILTCAHEPKCSLVSHRFRNINDVASAKRIMNDFGNDFTFQDVIPELLDVPDVARSFLRTLSQRILSVPLGVGDHYSLRGRDLVEDQKSLETFFYQYKALSVEGARRARTEYDPELMDLLKSLPY
jgi:hypothetical protein